MIRYIGKTIELYVIVGSTVVVVVVVEFIIYNPNIENIVNVGRML